MLIDKFAFQSVEITLHRSVVVRTPGTAHALGYIVVGAVVGEFLRGVLGTLVAVEYHAVFQHPWVLIYCCFKCLFSKLCRNMSAMYACDNAAVIQVDNRAVVSHTAVCQRYVGKVCTPDFVRGRGGEILFEQILKNLVSRPFVVAWLMPPGHGKQFEFHVHVLVAGGSADADAFVFQKYSHQSVTGNPFTFMIDPGYDSQELRLILAILCFSVLEIIVVSVRAYPEPSEKPS